MGACNFQTTGMGKNAQEVFRTLVQQAEYEYGVDAYNGTISTVDGFKMTKLPARKNLGKHMDERWDVIDKRACECIELSKYAASKWKAKYGLKGKRGKVFVFFGWAAE